MKKAGFIMLVFAFLATAMFTFAAGQAEEAATESAAGVYSGVAAGYHGDVTVSVELDDDEAIKSVTVDKNHNETEGVGTTAISKISEAIVKNQSLGIDTVTGATLTSSAVIAATADALKKAGVDPKDMGYTEKTATKEESVEFDPAAMPEKKPVTGSVTVTDVKGRKVEIDLPVSTYAISTMDVIDYMIPLLGEDAFNMLVASGQDGGHGIQGYSKLYVPIIGPYLKHFGQISEHNAPFDLEMILAMNPDVLIVNSAMGAHRYALEIESQLTEAGIPIVLIDIPGKSFTTSAQNTLKLLGTIFEKEARATEVTDFLDKQFELVTSKNLTERDDKPSVYYEKSGYSEVFGSTQSSASTGWGAVIAAAGAENIADELFMGTPSEKSGRGSLDPEFVLNADPDFIFLSGSGAGWMDKFPGSQGKVPSFDIVNRVGWSGLKAVQNKNVYEFAHAMSRSIYGFYACLKMATILYPDEFTGVSPDKIMDEFFERFMIVDSSITGWVYRYGESE